MKSRYALAVPCLSTLCALIAVNAHAAITWTGVQLNTADVEGYMAIAVVGLAVMWGLRKVIKMMNRS